MTANILFQVQNIYTVTPLVFSILIAVMMITGMWRREINLMVFLVIDGICTSMFQYGFIFEAFVLIDVSATIVVIYALIRKRSSSDPKDKR